MQFRLPERTPVHIRLIVNRESAFDHLHCNRTQKSAGIMKHQPKPSAGQSSLPKEEIRLLQFPGLVLTKYYGNCFYNSYSVRHACCASYGHARKRSGRRSRRLLSRICPNFWLQLANSYSVFKFPVMVPGTPTHAYSIQACICCVKQCANVYRHYFTKLLFNNA